ncbi:MAG: HDIG domain-containing protein [Verrucomicrobia bacterium]|nr:MAG: HDIG domain-containing protein [Verrucomicrobiota bacterium]
MAGISHAGIAGCQDLETRLASRPQQVRQPPVQREQPINNVVGFLDAIKRWQLARQGFSSGRKRRVYSENPAIQALEESFTVKFALYATFAMASVVLILKADDYGSAEESLRRAVFGLVLALAAVVMLHATRQAPCRRNSRITLVLGGNLAHLLIVSLILRLTQSTDSPEVLRYLLVPFALAPMLHGVLLGRVVGTFSAICVSLISSLLVPPQDMLGFLTISLVSGLSAVLLTGTVRKRGQLLRAGILTGVVSLIIANLWGRLDLVSCFGSGTMDHLKVFCLGSAAALGTAVFVALFISGLLPVFEELFQLTTDISWLELSDLNHTLLRQMQLEAPGTFHHSLVVASLAEAAAEKIGANALMCRVCAYFHDVGKLKKPAYFIENQQDGAENPHDALTPTMSALIIIAHLKDGVDIAVKHKLNPRIINVIQEHHGDSLVHYFYRRAQEQKKTNLDKVDRGLENPEDLPHVDEKNFRYPGQLPSTRESGIIALADMIESASRSLRKPTLAKIRTMIEELVRSKMTDGQLDDCPLTLRELTVVKDSFAATLRSMLHARIDYPREDDRGPPTPKRSELQRPRPSEGEINSKHLPPQAAASPA